MRVRIRYPAGMAIDQDRVADAVRLALAGGEDPEKIWRVNTVPAIAQLEEATYAEGSQDLAQLYDDIAGALHLPHDLPARAVLEKAARRGVKGQEGQTAFDFEQEHPREAAGTSDERYKPGEFVPRGKGAAPKPVQPKTQKAPASEPKPLPLPVGDGKQRTGGRPVRVNSTTALKRQFVFREVARQRSMPKAELEFHLTGAAGAFMDLADVLGLDDHEIGFGQTLGFELGEPSIDKAYAAYYPEQRTIAMSPDVGSGSLAHEWWHAFDNIVGQHLLREAEPDEYFSGAPDDTHRQPPLAQAMRKLCKTIQGTHFAHDGAMLDQAMRLEHPYWGNMVELTARAFASFVQDRLVDESRKNTYLVDKTIGDDKSRRGGLAVFPEGSERWRINAAFEAVFAAARADRQFLKSLASGTPRSMVLFLEKAARRKSKATEGQLGFSFDEEAHPRQQKGEAEGKYKPGEFIPKEQPAKERAFAALGEAVTMALEGRKLEKILAARLEDPATYEGLDDTTLSRRHRELEYEMIQAPRRARNAGQEHLAEALKEMDAEDMEEGRQLFDFQFDHQVAQISAQANEALSQEPRDEKRAVALGEVMQDMALARSDILAKLYGLKHEAVKGKRSRAWREKAWVKVPDKPEGWEGAEISPKRAREEAEIIGNEIANYAALIARGETTEESVAGYLKKRKALRKSLWEWAHLADQAAKLYMAATFRTGEGIDDRAPEADPDAKGHARVNLQWKRGEKLTEKEWRTKYGFAPDRGPEMLKMGEANHRMARQPHDLGMGSDVTYYGPKSKVFMDEARAMAGRVRQAFPQWIQDRVTARGGRQRFTVGPPERVNFITEDDYLSAVSKWTTDRPVDRLAGYYSPKNRFAANRIGQSLPGVGHSGAVNLEIHEYAHMADYLLGPDPDTYERLSKSSEFRDILNGMRDYVGNYYQTEVELFAEGLAGYLVHEETRKQWHEEAPPQWRRLARYFQRVLKEPGTEGALLEKSGRGLRLILRVGKLEKGGAIMTGDKPEPAGRPGQFVRGIIRPTDYDGPDILAEFLPDDEQITGPEEEGGDEE